MSKKYDNSDVHKEFQSLSRINMFKTFLFLTLGFVGIAEGAKHAYRAGTTDGADTLAKGIEYGVDHLYD